MLVDGHAMPQPPQFCGSVSVSTQTRLQQLPTAQSVSWRHAWLPPVPLVLDVVVLLLVLEVLLVVVLVLVAAPPVPVLELDTVVLLVLVVAPPVPPLVVAPC